MARSTSRTAAGCSNRGKCFRHPPIMLPWLGAFPPLLDGIPSRPSPSLVPIRPSTLSIGVESVGILPVRFSRGAFQRGTPRSTPFLSPLPLLSLPIYQQTLPCLVSWTPLPLSWAFQNPRRMEEKMGNEVSTPIAVFHPALKTTTRPIPSCLLSSHGTALVWMF